MKYLKRLFLAVTVLAVGGFVWWAGMNYTGYCHAQGRYLSDEELIQAAIRHNVSEMNIDGSEESIINFHKNNPRCCSVNREGNTASSKIEKLFGFYYSVVELNYEIRQDKKDLPTIRKFNFYTQYVAVDACGNGGGAYGEQAQTPK